MMEYKDKAQNDQYIHWCLMPSPICHKIPNFNMQLKVLESQSYPT